MPYIKQKDREKFIDFLSSMVQIDIENPGELNYLITCLISHYINNKKGKIRYQYLNDVIGALEGAKMELYRRLVSLYEDIKIKENGDI